MAVKRHKHYFQYVHMSCMVVNIYLFSVFPEINLTLPIVKYLFPGTYHVEN